MTALNIQVDSPVDPGVAGLLADYVTASRATFAPHSHYVLDAASLNEPGVEFWSARDGGRTVGCIALKTLDSKNGEIKSLCVDISARGQGHGRRLVEYVTAVARSRGMRQLWLETGNMEFYAAARELYSSLGFTRCGPFGNYADHPVSCFMQLEL